MPSPLLSFGKVTSFNFEPPAHGGRKGHSRHIMVILFVCGVFDARKIDTQKSRPVKTIEFALGTQRYQVAMHSWQGRFFLEFPSVAAAPQWVSSQFCSRFHFLLLFLSI